MARIETYPLDGNISVNDFVIGSDGDSLNATKNYKILTFLDYLGRLYNLNSTDLLFNYNNVASGSVGEGEVSTNNFADGTILMSGVTNIYVSKITVFGQLVDDILNTIGSNGLTIMFTDMGNRNNLGIFTVNSAVDVDANTINLSVTPSTTSGSIVTGRVMGIRIGVGGGGSASFETVTTNRVISIISNPHSFTSIPANVDVVTRFINGVTHIKLFFSLTSPALTSGNDYRLDLKVLSAALGGLPESALSVAYGNFNLVGQDVIAYVDTNGDIRISYHIKNPPTASAQSLSVRIGGSYINS